MSVKPLRIALTADPELPVPPELYGGIERIVDLLAVGLVERGHEVTLFAHPDSKSAGTLVPWRGRSSRSPVDTVSNAATLARAVFAGRFDLVHSFSRIAYLSAVLPLGIPKLMTYQRAISPRSVKWGHLVSRSSLEFCGISEWMIRDVADLGRWHVVPNGVPLKTFTFQARVAPQAPLAFLGRVEEIKGPHLAIELARRAGLPLVIAGNVPPEHQAWFEAKIQPHIDGDQIRFVGPVNDVQKNELLGQARALLMPILWDEPFGIVMAEAMACGTPVIGHNRGAVPEVVVDGHTGFVRDDIDGLIEATERIPEINRVECRERVENLYSEVALVNSYMNVYCEILDRRKSK